MKTIFISIFQGVEVKNILRTGIVDNILKDSDTRVVLFTKNKDRVDYYEKEFNDLRLIYEVVEKIDSKGLDAFFSKIKFTLLKTPTTDLKRRLLFESDRNFFRYYFNSLINTIIARPFFRKLARVIDYKFVRNDTYAKYFNKYKPDLVFLAHLFDETESYMLREAKKRKVKSIGFINSWDKITARCSLRLLPDKFVVFNNIVKDELIKYNEVKGENILISGIPHYDQYFKGGVSSRYDFFKKININPKGKLIVYASAGRSQSNSDLFMINLLSRFTKQGKFGKNVDLLVRFQPNDFIDKVELAHIKGLSYDYPGIRFSSKRGVDWDMDFNDLAHLKDTLHHMDVLISYTSSMCIDAAVFNKPIININFELDSSQPAHKLPTRYFIVDHYQKVMKTGAVSLVNNQEELISQINHYLKNPETRAQERKNLVDAQCHYKDGNAAKRISDFILSELN